MHAGLCLLRLDPETFWRLSPREFAAMTGAYAPAAAAQAGTRPDRAALEALIGLFPDDTR